MKNISVLGSTGSIGRSSLAIASRLRDRFRVVGLAAGSNLGLLLRQVEEFRPAIVSMKRREDALEFSSCCRVRPLRIAFGPEGAEEVAGFEENDVVISAITGIEGLRPTLAAVRSGKTVGLANKESMVAAGEFLRKEARRSKTMIVPVDSEHSGVFQCLARAKKKHVKRIILTASGGPFFRSPLKEMKSKTLEEALAHPRWKMGKKVTVDSATLMNKGLELIEARWLFLADPGRLDVLIHPQSLVHALVEMRDGSVLAQLSPTDMKIPIQYALTYPEREEAPLEPLDLARVGRLEFYPVDVRRFPLFRLARLALEAGDSLPIALNAANEVAVEAFLSRAIPFPAIAEVVEESLEVHRKTPVGELEAVFSIDRAVRLETKKILKKRS